MTNHSSKRSATADGLRRDTKRGGHTRRAGPRNRLGLQIKADLEQDILSGRLRPGDRIPSEIELTKKYSCSRMTVSTALSALVQGGLIVRKPRAGSHVATPPADQAIMEIQNLAEEAKRTGCEYSYKVTKLGKERLSSTLARNAGFSVGEPLLRICILHEIDGQVYAHEDRLISLRVAPEAAQADFNKTPPTEWLNNNVPWNDAEHVISAVNADVFIAETLGVPIGAACLVLQRQTWHAGDLVTCVVLTYPGSRRMRGRFSPATGGRK